MLQRSSTIDVLARAPNTARRLGAPPALQGVDGVVAGFRWDRRDEHSQAWYPQGISGSFEGLQRRRPRSRGVLLVSWYSKDGAGARVSFVALGSSRIRYRHVPLVEPVWRDGTPDFRPVVTHAGGISWFGRYLYVADSSHGLRVFDLRRILRTTGRDRRTTGRDERGRYHASGHAYVLPQIASYIQPTRATWFSFVSVDRSTSPPSLLTGEYRRGKPGGRILRWRLDPRNGLVVPGPAWQAFASPVTNMQGVLSHAGQLFVSASRGVTRQGTLAWGTPGQSLGSKTWAVGPEDLAFSRFSGLMYSLSEHPGQRTVFAIRLRPSG